MKASTTDTIEHLTKLVAQEWTAQQGGQLVVAHFLRMAIKDISQALSPTMIGRSDDLQIQQ